MKREGWLMCVDQDDIVNCGCKGIVPCYRKSEKFIRKAAETAFPSKDRKEVYFLYDHQYTQKVCEMNTAKFVDYVRTHGRRVL